MPKIAVVIPTYNRANIVTRAVQTVLSQSLPAAEVFVVNDGSNDNTREVLSRIDGRVKVIHQNNAGLSGARNTGILAATSDWVAFLDDDDEYTVDRLAVVAESIKRHPDAIVHMTNIAIVANDNSEVDLYGLRGYNVNFHARLDRPLLWGLRGCAFAQGLVVRRDLLVKVGLFRKTFYEDMDMFIRLAGLGFWTVDPRCTVRLIRRPGEDLNLSSLWKSKPVENYSALVRIHRDAMQYSFLTEEEKLSVVSGLATNLFELGCAYYAQADVISGGNCFLEVVRSAPFLRSKIKSFCLLHSRSLGVCWAKKRNDRKRAIRA